MSSAFNQITTMLFFTCCIEHNYMTMSILTPHQACTSLLWMYLQLIVPGFNHGGLLQVDMMKCFLALLHFRHTFKPSSDADCIHTNIFFVVPIIWFYLHIHRALIQKHCDDLLMRCLLVLFNISDSISYHCCWKVMTYNCLQISALTGIVCYFYWFQYRLKSVAKSVYYSKVEEWYFWEVPVNLVTLMSSEILNEIHEQNF